MLSLHKLSLVLVLGAAALAAPAHANVNVVATLPSLAAIAKEVGGDNVDVDALAAPTQDPHFVDAKPNLVLKLNKADLVIVNGMELEIGWLPPLLVQARNMKIQQGGPGYFDASTALTKRMGPAGRIDRSMGDVHPGGNPHFLYDARAGLDVARALGQRLAEIDPANAAGYKQRTDALVQKLGAIIAAQQQRFTALTPAQRKVVSYHESFPYLWDWLGLDSVATVEPKPGVPPDPGHVAQVLGVMKAQAVKALVQEEFYPTSTSKTLGQLTHAKLVIIQGSPRFAQGETYVQYVTKLTDDLYKALTT